MIFLAEGEQGASFRVRAAVRIDGSTSPVGAGSIVDDIGWGAAVAAFPTFDGSSAATLLVSASFDARGGAATGALYYLPLRSAPPSLRFVDGDGCCAEVSSGVATEQTPIALSPGDMASSDGNGLSAIDDFSGDGVPDLIFGVPNHAPPPGPQHDAADMLGVGVVYFATMTTSEDAAFADAQLVSMDNGLQPGASLPLQPGAAFGAAATGMTDWDGDGAPEAAVGATHTPYSGEGDVGEVWVLYTAGSRPEVRATSRIGRPDLPLQAGGLFGAGLAVLPDVDGDGKEELVVAAPLATHQNDVGGSGVVYIVFLADGPQGTAAVREYALLDIGVPRVEFGHALAPLLRRPGEDLQALCITSFDDSGEISHAGLLSLWSLDADGFVDGSAIEVGQVELAAQGLQPQQDEYWGRSATNMPDSDGNGIDELLVGAKGNSRGYSFVDVLFFIEAGPGTLVLEDIVRLTPPPQVGGADWGAMQWGSSVAIIPHPGDSTPVLVAGASGLDSDAGGVYLLRFAAGARMWTVSVAGTTARVVGSSNTTLQLSARGTTAAVAAQSCDASCAGGCLAGTSAADCDSGICATGYTTTSHGACCPDRIDGRPMFYIVESEECIVCHESCASGCSGPEDDQCDACSASYWLDKDTNRCRAETECDARFEFVLSEASDTTDRRCGNCSAACVAGAGCTGPSVMECAAVALVASGGGETAASHPVSMLWVLPDGSTKIAATLPIGSAAPLVGIGAGTVADPERVRLIALNRVGQLWSVSVSFMQSTIPEATYAGFAGGECVSMSVSGSAVLIVRDDGQIVRLQLDDAPAGQLIAQPVHRDSSEAATAVATARRPDGTLDIWWGSATGVVRRLREDSPTLLVYGSTVAVVSMTVSRYDGEVRWLGEDGLVRMASAATGPDPDGDEPTVAPHVFADALGGIASIGMSRSLAVVDDKADDSGPRNETFRLPKTPPTLLTPPPPDREGVHMAAGGDSIAMISDVSGDGAGDVVVGVPSAQAGRVIVYTLPTIGAPTSLSTITAEQAVAGDGVGHSVTQLLGWGWTDADYPIVACGAPGRNSNTGAIFLMAIGPSGSLLQQAVIEGSTMGSTQGGGAGWALAALPDRNGDGLGEVAVGEPDFGADGRGRVLIVELFADNLDFPSFEAVHVLEPTSLNTADAQRFGASLSQHAWPGSAEPLIAVGVPDGVASVGGNDTAVGQVMLLLGEQASQPLEISETTGWPIGTLPPSGEGSQFGACVTLIRDIDGDGYPELFVGTPVPSGVGHVDLFYLSGAVPVVAAVTRVAVPSTGEQYVVPGARLGSAVALLGFATERPRLAIGISHSDAAGTGSGAVLVTNVSPPRAAEPRVAGVVELSVRTEASDGWAPTGTTADRNTGLGGSGNGIAVIDDVDGDGTDDLLIGTGADVAGIFILRLLRDGGATVLRRIDGASGILDTGEVALPVGRSFGSSVASFRGAPLPQLAASEPGFDGSRGAVWLMGLQPTTLLVASVTRIDSTSIPTVRPDNRLCSAMITVPDISGDSEQEVVCTANSGADDEVLYIISVSSGDMSYASHSAVQSHQISASVGAETMSSLTMITWRAVDGDATVGSVGFLVALGVPSHDSINPNSGAAFLLDLDVDTANSGTLRGVFELSNSEGGLVDALGDVMLSNTQWGVVGGSGDLDGDGKLRSAPPALGCPLTLFSTCCGYVSKALRTC